MVGDKYKKLPKHGWVYSNIKKSKNKEKEAKVILLGDSVANQLYKHNRYNKTFYSMACTAAIGVVGQYILLSEFLENNSPDEVLLICNPGTLHNDLTIESTFHHFLKPFYNREYKHYMSPNVKDRVKTIPFYYLSQLPNVKTTTWGPNYEPLKPNTDWISTLSAEYLRKMKELCDAKGVGLTVIPSPVRTELKHNLDAHFMDEVAEFKLEDILSNYFHALEYYDKSEFKDAVHLKDANKYRRIYTEKLLASFPRLLDKEAFKPTKAEYLFSAIKEEE